MKQTFFKLLAVMLIGFAALTSCKKELLPQEQTTNVTFSFRVNDPGTDPTSTKSAIDSDEEALKVINIAFYNSSTKILEAENCFTAKSFTMNSVPNVNCDVLVMANVKTDSYKWPESLDDALNIEESVSVSSLNANGIPMAGKTSWSAGTTSVTVGLDRLVSRYDVTANKKFTYGTWTLKGVTFSNAANTVTPFKENASPSSKGTFDYATVDDVNNLNGGSTASFYLPEMVGSTAQIKIEGEWTATDMKRTASYELAVGSGNNKRNMKYQVKLDADSSNPVWSVIIGDDQFNNRFVYAGANPLAVTNNGNASTTTLTASSADLQYRLEAASSTADYATAALSFSTDGSNWCSYSNLNTFVLTGSVATLYVKSGYTGASTFDVPFRFVSADGKVLPAAAGQSADGNTLNIKVAPTAHISTLTFKVNNSNIPWFKVAEVSGLNSALVGNSGRLPFGNEIKIPYSCDITSLDLYLNFSPFETSNQNKAISVTITLNGATLAEYSDVLAGDVDINPIDFVLNNYGENPVFEFNISDSGIESPSSFSSYSELGYYKKVMKDTPYSASVSGNVTVSGTSNVSGHKSGNTITYKSNGAVGSIEQMYIIDQNGHYCHTMLLESTTATGAQINNASVVVTNGSLIVTEVAIRSFSLNINGTPYNLVEGDNAINTTIAQEVTGSLILKKSDENDVQNRLVVKVGNVTAYIGAIYWPNGVEHSYSDTEVITFTIPYSQVNSIGANPTISITVDDPS